MLNALLMVRRFWWSVPIVLLVAALFITRGTLERRTEALESFKKAYAQLEADIRSKTQLAKALDEAHARRVERDQEKERADHEAETQRLRADYSQRVRDYAKAHPGSSRAADLPRTAETATEPAPAGETAVVPVKDLEICAVNTAAAEGWLNWWKSVEAIER